MKSYRTALVFLLPIFFLLYLEEGLAQAWQLDTTFGQGGVVSTAFNTTGNSSSNSIAIQADGKIVAGASSQNGGHNEFAIIRCNIDGNIDKTFGTNGVVTTQVGTAGNDVNSVAIQSDGKIVAGGDCNNETQTVFALVRYNTNGSLDTTFGTNGVVTTLIGSGGDYVKSIAIQSDGKIVAAGASVNKGLDNLALVRYNSDGSLDPQFGKGGITTLGETGMIATSDPYAGTSYYANSVAIQNDGKIVAAGYTFFLDETKFVYHGFFLIARYNSNGTLDNTFLGAGYGLEAFADPIQSQEDEANSVLIQKDGKIIVAGNYYPGYYNFAILRLNSNGAGDGSFGTNGLVITDLTGVSGAYAAAIQSDGKILVVGFGGTLLRHYFALIRYNTDGSLDNSFGTKGVVTSELGSSSDEGYSIAIQNDRGIVIGGSYNNGIFEELALARYDYTGTIDNTFGTNGFYISSVGNTNDVANSIAVQKFDDKLVVAGSSDNGSTSSFTLLRYNSNGTLDRFFGTNGIVSTNIGSSSSQANSVAIDSDGTIAAAGFYFNGKNNDFAVVRYTPGGVPDNIFGTNGIAVTPIGAFDDEATSVAIQKDHKIVEAGYYLNGNYDNIAVVRYNTNGVLDNSFGEDGIVTTQVGTSNCFAQSIAIQKDGKIDIAGSAIIGGNYNITLIRYNDDGSLDNNFGNDGIITTQIGKAGFAYSVLIQDDGKIVAAGYTLIGSNDEFALVRYNSDGTPDNTFGTDGIATTKIGSTSDYAYSAAIQGDGKIVAAGYAEDRNKFEFALARYNTDGTLDNSFGNIGTLLNQTSISNDFAHSVAVQNDGKIVAAGFASSPGISNYKIFTLVRYNNNTATGIKLINNSQDVPASFRLEQNYPNPFNPSTTIKYSLPERSFVTIKVYDLLGREASLLFNSTLNPGTYESEFNAENLSSGVYIYSIYSKGLNSNKEFRSSRKMILLK